MKVSLLVLAAGMGARFGCMKQVEAVGPHGEAIIEYSAYDAAAVGFDEIVFVVRQAMEADFHSTILSRIQKTLPCRLVFQEPGDLAGINVPDRPKPWGTGHALLCAEGAVDSPFAVINADDWYGRNSLRLVHDFLATSDILSAHWCMGAYHLRNTTSPHGPVARGLCSMNEEGDLVAVEERENIEMGPDRRFASRGPGGENSNVDGDSLVSMNLWGFTPRVFGIGKALFRDFLRGQDSSPSAEFYLPGLVDAAIRGGKAKVRALPTDDPWFGLTWREDLGLARARISGLVEEGFYPSALLARAGPESARPLV